MLIKHIFDNWTSTTGDIAKPVTMEGQTQLIEFRTGIKSDLKQLQVLTLQGQTRIAQPNGDSGYLQVGQKAYSLMTQVLVTVKADNQVMNDTSENLRIMDQEILNICGTYKNSSKTGDMVGIKDLVYDVGDRQYESEDDFDKSEWVSIHSVWLWYELIDIT